MNQKHLKPASLLGLVALLLALLTACGDSPATATPASGGQTSPTINPTVQALLTAAPTPGAPAKLANSTLPAVKNGTAKLLGPLDGTSLVNFSIALKLPKGKADDLQKAIDTIGEPGKQTTPFLTSDDFLQKYAPTEDQVKAVQAYMQKNGIELVSIASNRLSATFRAPAQLLQDTFKVKMNRYQETRTVKAQPQNASTPNDTAPSESEPGQLPNTGGTNFTPGKGKGTNTTQQTVEFYANDTDLTIPENYLPYIEAVTLNNYPVAASALSRNPQDQSSKFQGYFPEQLRAAYNITPLAKAGLDGSGQSIAIFASGGFKRSDIDTYTKTFNLPSANIETILVNGADGKPNKDVGEVELDIEVVLAIAPKAKILVYEVPNLSLRNFQAGINAMVAENKAKILNISYGGCELVHDPNSLKALHTIFSQARSQGQTVFVSSGDDGAFDCAANDESLADKLAVDSPASDPYATAVGGTALALKNGQYGAEVVWGEPDDPSGGGGGVSVFWALPSYQKNYNVKSLNPNGARQMPDVSAVADSYTGYAIYCSVSAEACGRVGWSIIGGTSASAPLWAAGTALIDQYLAAKFSGGQALLLGPDHLYILQNAYAAKVITSPPYHDINQGDNLYYKAGQGYDLATGLGTPDFLNIAVGIEQLYKQAS